MILVIGFFCLLVFLYSLYILGKDDYYLMKKNFFIDHLFDFTLAGIISGFCVGRIVSFFVKVANRGGFFYNIFSVRDIPFFLNDLVLGCILAFYAIGKYKKIPIGHLFDFISLAFLTCLPLWYISDAFYVKRNQLIIYIVLGICYLFTTVVFWKILLPRIISSKHKEGSLSSLFLIIFSFLTLAASFTYKIFSNAFVLGTEDILLLGMFLGGFVYLFRS